MRERQKLREAQRIGGIGSFEIDYRNGRVEWSQELNRLFGIDAETFVRGLAESREILHAPDGKRIQRLVAEILADGQPRELAHRYLRGQELRWAETRIEPLSENGERYGVRGTLQDITERKRAERELHLQAHLLDAVDVAVIATDLDGMVTHWNRGAQRMYGWERDEMLGRSVIDLTVGPEDDATEREATKAVGNLGVREGEFTVRRKDGSRFPAS
jgi:PAS domain S-box-containing protein